MNKKGKAPKLQEVSPLLAGDLEFYDEGMPHCCGIAVVGEFALTYDGEADLDITKLHAAGPVLRRLRDRLTPGRLTLATTVMAEKDGSITHSSSQLAAETVLEEVGFERLVQFLGNGGRLLQLWGYNKAPPSQALIAKVERNWAKFNPIIPMEAL